MEVVPEDSSHLSASGPVKSPAPDAGSVKSPAPAAGPVKSPARAEEEEEEAPAAKKQKANPVGGGKKEKGKSKSTPKAAKNPPKPSVRASKRLAGEEALELTSSGTPTGIAKVVKGGFVQSTLSLTKTTKSPPSGMVGTLVNSTSSSSSAVGNAVSAALDGVDAMIQSQDSPMAHATVVTAPVALAAAPAAAAAAAAAAGSSDDSE